VPIASTPRRAEPAYDSAVRATTGRRLLRALLLTASVVLLATGPVEAAGAGVLRTRAASPWRSVPLPSQLYPGAMLLLTNGSVMVQDQGPKNSGNRAWWLLTPNDKGSYVDGSWRQIASLPKGYGPVSFASAVLPDGRVVIEGGEDNLGNGKAFTNRGAIYRPLANTWTSVAPPSGTEWKTIGDAPATVLADGTFMLGGSGNYTNTTQALLKPKTLSWAITGKGKVDYNEESSFDLLQNDEVLTVGVRSKPNYAELYNPSTGGWSSAGKVPVGVVDTSGGELGPVVTRPDGTAVVLGGTGHNAIYDPATKTWRTGPSFPVVDGKQPHCADAPAAVLPDGDVLIDASPGLYQPPSSFFLLDGSTLTRTANPPDAASLESNWGYMLVLPTGQVLFNGRDGQMEVYNAGGTPAANWRPVVTGVPTTLAPGHTYTISGTQLNGLSQGAYYGDDYQSATNYPLVRITSTATGHVFYARTFDMSSMAITPKLASHAQFQLPPGVPAGHATLVAVANGISSKAVSVTIS
jgi:hypothetical protein